MNPTDAKIIGFDLSQPATLTVSFPASLHGKILAIGETISVSTYSDREEQASLLERALDLLAGFLPEDEDGNPQHNYFKTYREAIDLLVRCGKLVETGPNQYEYVP